MLKKIISGGQTGADVAGLDAAIMELVCRDNPNYLDLTEHRLKLNPRHR